MKTCAASSSCPRFPPSRITAIISEHLSFYSSYGKNAVFPERHHGITVQAICRLKRAILNIGMETTRAARRAALRNPSRRLAVSAGVFVCASEFARTDRNKQYQAIFEYVSRHVHPMSPLIIAGDFNDWRQKSCLSLGSALNLQEVFIDTLGQRPKTFPARMPLLSLDRIYTRNLEVLDAQVPTKAGNGSFCPTICP